MSKKKREGFWIKTKKGHVGHILGDADMSQETLDAFMEMIDAAVEMEEEKNDDDETD